MNVFLETRFRHEMLHAAPAIPIAKNRCQSVPWLWDATILQLQLAVRGGISPNAGPTISKAPKWVRVALCLLTTWLLRDPQREAS